MKNNYFRILGMFLSIPVFSIGLANAMAIASAFVGDAYKGMNFMSSLMHWHSVMIDWICFIVFLLVPVLTGMTLLFIGNDRWWEITSLTCFACVFSFYCFFTVAVICNEIDGCFQMIKVSF